MKYIPGNFQKFGLNCIANVLNTTLLMDLDAEDAQLLIHECDIFHTESADRMIGPPPLELLWKATFDHGSPHTLYLAPPVDKCISCAHRLTTHNSPTVVICYTCDGPLPALKMTLRCDNCGINHR